MKINARVKFIEYCLSDISSHELSLIEACLMGRINIIEKDSQEHEEIKGMIDLISEEISRIDKI